MMRVGIIDVGSNTVRLLVASCAGNRLVPVHESRAFLGLGEEVENFGWISDLKLRETAWCVREQAAEARAHGVHHVEVVVTAPGRQSANATELVAALAEAAHASVRVLGPRRRDAFRTSVSLPGWTRSGSRSPSATSAAARPSSSSAPRPARPGSARSTSAQSG
jgi:hypothetical protein